MCETTQPLAQLVEIVLASPKYAAIEPDLVYRLGAEELGKRRNLKAAVKATKDRLHQVAGAYLERRPDYLRWLQRLRSAAEEGGLEALKPVCCELLAQHTSSRERLPYLQEFYAQTLGGLPPLNSVLDLACGLNPLAIPWMPLAPRATYRACDIYTDLVAFLSQALPLLGVAGDAYPCDVVAAPPRQPVDVALLLKTLPCLERLERGAGQRLLDALQARYILVSFPARSLGGRQKGMPENYEGYLQAALAGRGWQVVRHAFANELAFVIETGVTPEHGDSA
ncbi:MAG: 16S rRNA methyltransferase [Anaerolineae bacterium]